MRESLAGSLSSIYGAFRSQSSMHPPPPPRGGDSARRPPSEQTATPLAVALPTFLPQPLSQRQLFPANPPNLPTPRRSTHGNCSMPSLKINVPDATTNASSTSTAPSITTTRLRPRPTQASSRSPNCSPRQGRLLKDETLHDAIGQYEFLRREYPGSRYRADALLAEGDIYFRDLNDNVSAKATYQAFLKEYPRSAGATEARADLKELHSSDTASRHSPNPPTTTAARTSTPTATSTVPPPHQKHSNTVLTAAIQSQAAEAAPEPAPPTHTSVTTPPALTPAKTVPESQPSTQPPPVQGRNANPTDSAVELLRSPAPQRQASASWRSAALVNLDLHPRGHRSRR